MIKTILLDVGSRTLCIMAAASLPPNPKIGPDDVIVHDPIQFATLLDGVQPSISSAPRAVPSKPLPVAAAPPKKRSYTKADPDIYRASRSGGSGRGPRLGLLRITTADATKLRQMIESGDNAISPIERFIIRNHFGFGVEPKTFKEIVDMLSKSAFKNDDEWGDNKAAAHRICVLERQTLRRFGFLHRRRKSRS